MKIRRLMVFSTILLILCTISALLFGFATLEKWLGATSDFVLSAFALWIAFESYEIERRRRREEECKIAAENTVLDVATNGPAALESHEETIAKLMKAFRSVRASERIAIYGQFVSNLRGVDGKKKELLHLIGEKSYRASYKSRAYPQRYPEVLMSHSAA